MPPVLKILFYCRHNSVRAPLAAALAESIAAPKVEAFCAGLESSPISQDVEKTIIGLTGEAPKIIEDLSALAAMELGLVIVLVDKTHVSPASGMKLEECCSGADIVEWDMPAPRSDEDIKHIEIELAERLRLMFLARHLI